MSGSLTSAETNIGHVLGAVKKRKRREFHRVCCTIVTPVRRGVPRGLVLTKHEKEIRRFWQLSIS